MTGLNLHALVRGAIQVVNPDVPGDVYLSTGSGWLDGIPTPTFALLPADRLQLQAMDHGEQFHVNAITGTRIDAKLYAYGQFSSVVRPEGKGGDLVRLGNEWWAVQHVMEWWPGWCCVAISRQINADTLAALLKALENGAVPTAGATP